MNVISENRMLLAFSAVILLAMFVLFTVRQQTNQFTNHKVSNSQVSDEELLPTRQFEDADIVAIAHISDVGQILYLSSSNEISTTPPANNNEYAQFRIISLQVERVIKPADLTMDQIIVPTIPASELPPSEYSNMLERGGSHGLIFVSNFPDYPDSTNPVIEYIRNALLPNDWNPIVTSEWYEFVGNRARNGRGAEYLKSDLFSTLGISE